MKEKLIYIATDQMEADFIVNFLKENGIPSYYKSRGAGQFMSLYFGSWISAEISIIIPEAAYDKARELLEGIGKEPVSEPEA